MKRRLLTILLLIGMLGCKAQVPDVHTFSYRYVDSLMFLIDSFRMVSNNMVADDISISITGETDSTLTTITKSGTTITCTIQAGKKRITSNMSNGERSIWFMNDTDTNSYSIGHYKLDRNDLPVNISYK